MTPRHTSFHLEIGRHFSPTEEEKKRERERERERDPSSLLLSSLFPSFVFLSLRVDTSFVDRRDSRDQLPPPPPLLPPPSLLSPSLSFWTRRLFVVKAKWCRTGRSFILGRKDRSDWKRSTLAISDTPALYRSPSLLPSEKRRGERERESREGIFRNCWAAPFGEWTRPTRSDLGGRGEGEGRERKARGFWVNGLPVARPSPNRSRAEHGNFDNPN